MKNLSRGCLLLLIVAIFAFPSRASAMHISEGILPPSWAGLWLMAAIPFVALGLREIQQRGRQVLFFKPMVALVGAAVFIISCMPVPVPTAGTCSHPCGTGLAAVLIGPGPTVVVASIALLLQALFLAHGGLTTLGANIVSMGVAGGLTGWIIFYISRRLGFSLFIAGFLAGIFSDWATYAVTSFELASALHGSGSLGEMFLIIVSAFVPTQLPLGILEGFLTGGAVCFIQSRRPSLISRWGKLEGGFS